MDHIRPIDDRAPIGLWLADLSAAPTLREDEWLGDEERQRASRFVHDLHRRRYVAAHVAIRLIVQRSCGIAARHQTWVREPRGKWHLHGHPIWRLSFSYAGDIALIGLARHQPIGVDAELVHAVDDADDLAAIYFDHRERESFSRVPRQHRDRAFLRGWTRKEACLKAIGIGLAGVPQSFHTGLVGTGRASLDGRPVEVGSFALPGLVGSWARLR